MGQILHGSATTTEDSNGADGVLLTVTSTDPKEVQHIRGLDFIRILVSGTHHQPHHLAMAKGDSRTRTEWRFRTAALEHRDGD